MKGWSRALWVLLFVSVLSCKNQKPQPTDTGSTGTIHISVDETFKPIIEEQIQVFESSFPNAKIIAHYKSEAECWDDLLNDSTRMVIVTKNITQEESRFYLDSIGLYPQGEVLAYDAVALVVNRNAPDSVFTKAEVAGMLLDTGKMPYKPVFDGVKATSTVRFAIDSILGGKMFNLSVITAAKTSREVLAYIADNPGYIGFVGVSWIGNPEDEGQLEMLKKLRIAWLPCDSCAEEGSYTKPWQAEILTKRYPYSRGIYYVLKENHGGLGKAFVNFMNSDRGQLIFRRGYVVPGRRIFIIRETQMKLVKPVKQ